MTVHFIIEAISLCQKFHLNNQSCLPNVVISVNQTELTKQVPKGWSISFELWKTLFISVGNQWRGIINWNFEISRNIIKHV